MPRMVSGTVRVMRVLRRRCTDCSGVAGSAKKLPLRKREHSTLGVSSRELVPSAGGRLHKFRKKPLAAQVLFCSGELLPGTDRHNPKMLAPRRGATATKANPSPAAADWAFLIPRTLLLCS